VVIVDNGFPTMGDSRSLLAGREFPFPVKFAQYHGQSYSGSINLGVQQCDGDVLLLANNDVEWLPESSIAPLIEHLVRHPTDGIAGPQLVFPDGRWQRSAGEFPSLLEGLRTLLLMGVLENRVAAARYKRGEPGRPVQEVEYVDGACMAVSRACFEALQGWDPAFEFYACDADFNWRAQRAGWRRVLVPAARVVHVRGASSSGTQKRMYAHRLFAAKRKMVERMHGQLSAAGYDVLQRVAAMEYALLYSVLDAVWSTPASRRRASTSRQVGLAALESL
jgi:GT2 family glycosyltransferase